MHSQAHNQRYENLAASICSTMKLSTSITLIIFSSSKGSIFLESFKLPMPLTKIPQDNSEVDAVESQPWVYKNQVPRALQSKGGGVQILSQPPGMTVGRSSEPTPVWRLVSILIFLHYTIWVTDNVLKNENNLEINSFGNRKSSKFAA